MSNPEAKMKLFPWNHCNCVDHSVCGSTFVAAVRGGSSNRWGISVALTQTQLRPPLSVVGPGWFALDMLWGPRRWCLLDPGWLNASSSAANVGRSHGGSRSSGTGSVYWSCCFPSAGIVMSFFSHEPGHWNVDQLVILGTNCVPPYTNHFWYVAAADRC